MLQFFTQCHVEVLQLLFGASQSLLSSLEGENTLQVIQSTLGKKIAIWLLTKPSLLLETEVVQKEPCGAGVLPFSFLNP